MRALVERLASLRYPAVSRVAPVQPCVELALPFSVVFLHSVWNRSLVLRFEALRIFKIIEWIIFGLGTTVILELVLLIESFPEIL